MIFHTNLIDGDIVAYVSASSSENEEEWVALYRVDQFMQQVLEAVKSESYRVFLSGSDNFRYAIYPEYKANRKETVEPKHRQACKAHLITQWNAELVNGYEADDAMGFNKLHELDIISTIDKDLMMIPGWHYSWPIMRGNKIIREGKLDFVSELDGYKSFFKSMLVGDKADNIIGTAGIGKDKAEKLIEPCQSEKEMYDLVLSKYLDEDSELGFDRFLTNLDCLWIWRKENECYTSR